MGYSLTDYPTESKGYEVLGADRIGLLLFVEQVFEYKDNKYYARIAINMERIIGIEETPDGLSRVTIDNGSRESAVFILNESYEDFLHRIASSPEGY